MDAYYTNTAMAMQQIILSLLAVAFLGAAVFVYWWSNQPVVVIEEVATTTVPVAEVVDEGPLVPSYDTSLIEVPPTPPQPTGPTIDPTEQMEEALTTLEELLDESYDEGGIEEAFLADFDAVI
ncbi:MAG: hypothetical protein AAFO91_20370 [Bacteroidota bacterium]